jgi:3-(3-hydroxy-phenyl)propionate hydroxylase
VHTGAPPAGVCAWEQLGVNVIRLAGPQDQITGGVRDSGGTLIGWMAKKKAAALLVRPDGFVYAATDAGKSLPAPPAGLIGTTAPLSVAPIGNGVRA